MEIISNHLPVQDLLRCRLVCKLWAREMAQYLTKRKALVVAYEDCAEAREICKKKEAGKFVNISTLCILEIPITCQLINDVIRNFGETLSGLKLDDCNPTEEDLHNLLQAIPSLEVLSFKQTGVKPRRHRHHRDDDDDDDDEDAQELLRKSKLDMLTEFSEGLLIMPTVKKLSWEETKPVHNFERIIKMFPNVEELELLCWAKPTPEKLEGLRMDNLKVLTLSCDNHFAEEHFLALASLQLKLKKLTLHDVKPGGRRKMRGFKAFLGSIAGTLVEMNLNGNGRILQEMRAANSRNMGGGGMARYLQNSARQFCRQSTPFPIDFPNLQKLEIDCSLLADLKTIDYMPKLEKLECKFQDWKGWWHLLNTNGVPTTEHTKLRDLTLGAIDSGCLLKMAPFFASVTRLDVSEDRIDDVAFRTICQNMKQLSHLRITQSTNDASKKLQMTDVGITGIPREGVEELVKLLPQKQTAEEVEKLRTHSYVGNLTALYSLELALSQIQMTDVGVLYGIADLKRIATITLPKCDVIISLKTFLNFNVRFMMFELINDFTFSSQTHLYKPLAK